MTFLDHIQSFETSTKDVHVFFVNTFFYLRSFRQQPGVIHIPEFALNLVVVALNFCLYWSSDFCHFPLDEFWHFRKELFNFCIIFIKPIVVFSHWFTKTGVWSFIPTSLNFDHISAISRPVVKKLSRFSSSWAFSFCLVLIDFSFFRSRWFDGMAA